LRGWHFNLFHQYAEHEEALHLDSPSESTLERPVMTRPTKQKIGSPEMEEPRLDRMRNLFPLPAPIACRPRKIHLPRLAQKSRPTRDWIALTKETVSEPYQNSI